MSRIKKKATKEMHPRKPPFGCACSLEKNPHAIELALLRQSCSLTGIFLRFFAGFHEKASQAQIVIPLKNNYA